MSLNRNQLGVFLAVARAGSLTAAVDVLDVSQPAISAQLAALEEAVGMALFDRLPRGVRLTRAGEVLREHAERMEGVEAEARQAMDELRGVRKGLLSVGASLTVGAYLVPAYLGAFKRKFPGIGVKLEIANSHEIQERLGPDGAGDSRFEVGFIEGPLEKSEDLKAVVFAQDEMVPIVRRGHPFGSRVKVALEAFLAEGLISREVGSGSRDAVEKALGKKFDPVMALGSTEAIKSAVMAGLGVGIVSRLAVGSELDAGKLVVPQVMRGNGLLRIRRDLSYVVRKGRNLSPAAMQFLSLVPRRAAETAEIPEVEYEI